MLFLKLALLMICQNKTDRIFTKELEEDLCRILDLLCKNGADFSYVAPNTMCNVFEFYKEGQLSEMLRKYADH